MRFSLSHILISLSLAMVGCSQAPAPEPGAYKTSSSSTSDANASDQLPSHNDQNTTLPSNGNNNTSKAPASESQCAASGFYFDLVTNECTKRPLVKVTCTLENITSAQSDYRTLNAGAKSDFLADNQKAQVKLLFDNALAGYTLRYCVDDVEQYTLVAVKSQSGQNLVQDIDVPK